MEITIQPAKAGQAPDCLSCLKHSELWETYFKTNATAAHDIEEMIGQKQIHVAVNKDKDCIGFMGIVHNGCFRKFSYLALIAVQSRYRNKGVGLQMLKAFESAGFKQADRVFLLVSDFNKNARRLYTTFGYQSVGTIPDLYKRGVPEHVMVKYHS